jgi:hypothetical protein
VTIKAQQVFGHCLQELSTLHQTTHIGKINYPIMNILLNL